MLRRRPLTLAITALLAVAMWALPAHADARTKQLKVSESACLAAGGDFASYGRTKTCTTVAEATSTGPVVTTERKVPGPKGADKSVYIGTSQRVTVVETTTTRSQRGNGAVAVNSTERVSSHVVPLSCASYRHWVFVPGPNSPERDEYSEIALDLCHQVGAFAA